MAGAVEEPEGGKRPPPIRNTGKLGQGAINAHRLFGGAPHAARPVEVAPR